MKMTSQDACWRLDKAGRVQAGKLVRRHNYCPGMIARPRAGSDDGPDDKVGLTDIGKLNFLQSCTSEC